MVSERIYKHFEIYNNFTENFDYPLENNWEIIKIGDEEAKERCWKFYRKDLDQFLMNETVLLGSCSKNFGRKIYLIRLFTKIIV